MQWYCIQIYIWAASVLLFDPGFKLPLICGKEKGKLWGGVVYWL